MLVESQCKTALGKKVSVLKQLLAILNNLVLLFFSLGKTVRFYQWKQSQVCINIWVIPKYLLVNDLLNAAWQEAELYVQWVTNFIHP